MRTSQVLLSLLFSLAAYPAVSASNQVEKFDANNKCNSTAIDKPVRQQLVRSLQNYNDELSTVFSEYVQENPRDESIRLRVCLIVEPSGNVQSIKLFSSAPQETKLNNELENVLQRATFEGLFDSQAAFSYTLELVP